MCVNKEVWDKFQSEMKEDVRQLMHDVKGIKTSQQGLSMVFKDMEKHMDKLNGRTKTVEQKVINLEDEEFRAVRCVHKDVIPTLLTVEKFEEWERKKQEEKERERAKAMQSEFLVAQKLDTRQRKMQWIVAAITGAGMAIVSLITFFA